MIAPHSGALAAALVLGCGTWLADARAQALSDPMRPPAFAAPVAGAEGEPAAALVLQSTLMSGGRRIAMIDGKPMKVGDRIGEARIVAIEPTSVTLREGTGSRILELYRGVEITRPDARKPDEARTAPRKAKGSKKGTE